MALSTPTINKIDVFDATKEFEFEFSYSGTQAVKNRLVIRKNDDYSIVYDQTEERLKLTHTLPANTLINNTTYVVQVQVFDVDGNASTLSEAQNFSCHSTPSLVFTDITDGEMITTANLKSEITFTQNEGDSIKELEFLLYDNNKANIYSSNMYYDDFSNHVYYGLENLTNYYIRAIGSTVYGFTIDTGYIGIVVKYKTIVTNMSANIVPKNGQFFIDANIVAIDYDVKNNNYKIVNGEAIVGSDNVVTYNINHVDDNHTIIIRAMNKAHNITYANQLKLYVKSLKEKAEVESIAYGQDLTGEYLNTYNTIMEHEQSVAKAFIATE